MNIVHRLTKPQATILASKKRFVAVNAGRRFGKTWLSGAKAMKKLTEKDNAVVWYVAPTQNMARTVFWDNWIKLHIPDEWIKKKNEQLMVMELHNGSRLYVLSSENPDRLRGSGVDLLIMDECAFTKKEAYDIIRPVLSDKHHDGAAMYVSTPAGFNWFYELCQKAKENPDEWDFFQYTTEEGGNVSIEELEKAKRELSPKMYAQEYLASFETVSARVFENYDRVKNECELDEDWGLSDIHVGMDFNVNPMTAVISVEERGSLFIFDEIVEKNSNTQEMCNSIKRKYPLTTVYVYPDPTGRKRQTNAAVGQTDFDILRKNGFIVCSPSHPYATKDKFNTVNAALCNANNIRKVFIAKNKCPQLKKAFEGYAYKENGDTDKSSGLDHISDAASYLICYKLPMYGSRRVQKPSVLGV